jgi:hypothetical protein
MLERRPIYVLDAGHGGFALRDGSSPNRAAAHGLEEKDLALDLARRVRALLAPRADVQLTRYADVNLSLGERARIARDAGADAFVSLHFNGSPDPQTNETSAWVAPSAGPGSRDLAARLAESVGRAAGANAWGVGARDLGVLKVSRHHAGTNACLLEIAHLSNPDQAARLRDSAYRDHLAQAIAGALDIPSGAAYIRIEALVPHQQNPDKLYNACVRTNVHTGPSPVTKVDVVFHVHGFIYTKFDEVDLADLDTYAGLRFESKGGKRSRNTVGILPMGHKTKGVFDGKWVVDFPQFAKKENVEQIIAGALDWLATKHLNQKAGSIQRDRLILAAHSGGVERAAPIINAFNPDELHLFDGVYNAATFTSWAKGHIEADDRQLKGLDESQWDDYMAARGGALRCVFRDVTCSASKDLDASLNSLLGKVDVKRRKYLRKFYRAESTVKMNHYAVPRDCGPQLLVNSSADLADIEPIACPAATAKALDSKTDILAKLRDCGLIPSSVKTMADYESKVLKKDKVFGLNVTLHPDFLAKVKAAEAALGTTPHGVTDVSHYRANSASYHGWGLAIDLNPGENPYVMHESGEDDLDSQLKPAYHRIAWLMNGEESLIPSKLSTLVPPKYDVKAAYLALQAQSAMIPPYFALLKCTADELQKFIEGKKGLDWKNVWGKSTAPAQAELRSLIEADYKLLHDPPSDPKKGDQPFKHIDPKSKGFLNLSLALVKAMKDQIMRWGAIDLGGACGDMMHFDDGLSALGKFIYAAKKGSSPSCPASSKASSYTLQSATGTPAELRKYVLMPKDEKDTGLSTALDQLNKVFDATVKLKDADFRVKPETSSRMDSSLDVEGDSFWEGSVPVIRLIQSKYDIVAGHLKKPDTVKVHAVIRTIGHEKHHLWRQKIDRNPSNPINAVFEAEAAKRMEEVRKNWLDQVKNNPQLRRQMGIPATVTVTKWTDIPAAERAKIEKDATDTDYIQGLYENSAYLVEEMYTQIEELAYLRIQQRLGSAADIADSRSRLRAVSEMLDRLNTRLHSLAAQDALITPELATKTDAAILKYLRDRYPHPSDKKLDSFTVIFFLASIEFRQPPIFDNAGKLISKTPKGARVP